MHSKLFIREVCEAIVAEYGKEVMSLPITEHMAIRAPRHIEILFCHIIGVARCRLYIYLGEY